MKKRCKSSLKSHYVNLNNAIWNYLRGKMSAKLTIGKYQHYKGNFYQVEDIAIHSETDEEMVVYRPLYGEGRLWVRPLSMFVEDVEVDGKRQPRFALVNED